MDAIRHIRDISGAWTMFIPINQKASRKRVWSASTTVYGRMFGLSWERRPRHVRTFSRPGRGSTLKSSSWPTSKMQLLLQSTSPAASLLSKDATVCINPSGLRLRVRALPRLERHVPPPGKCPGLHQRNRDRRI